MLAGAAAGRVPLPDPSARIGQPLLIYRHLSSLFPMSAPQQPVYPDEPKIPILPNMLTAGNLLCGFVSILTIFKGMKYGDGTPEAFEYYQQATYFIFAACIFDLLDGRVARLCKSDGPFGREFDSIADVVSFGIAPAMLLARAVLFKLPVSYVGDLIAGLYLLCSALRLARFNCMAAAPKKPNQSMDFVGLPVPMAAGAVVSTMYLVIDITTNRNLVIAPLWQVLMAITMTIVSLLMMSRVIYPSFKHVTFEKRGTITAMLIAVAAVCSLVCFPWIAPALIFLCYLLYGLVVRPFLTRKGRYALELKDEEDEEDNQG